MLDEKLKKEIADCNEAKEAREISAVIANKAQVITMNLKKDLEIITLFADDMIRVLDDDILLEPMISVLEDESYVYDLSVSII